MESTIELLGRQNIATAETGIHRGLKIPRVVPKGWSKLNKRAHVAILHASAPKYNCPGNSFGLKF